MKITILITLLTAFSTLASSQDFMEKIAEKACECLTSIPDTLGPERYNLELGLCMIEAAAPYKKQLKKEYGIDLNKIDTQGEELGSVVGLKMASVCPDALMEMVLKADVEIEEEDAAVSYIDGHITKIEENKFIVFSLMDAKGKTTKFYWLTFIETNLNFELTSQYKSLMNETVRITYTPQEFFDYRIAEYRIYNVIHKIQVIS